MQCDVIMEDANIKSAINNLHGARLYISVLIELFVSGVTFDVICSVFVC